MAMVLFAGVASAQTITTPTQNLKLQYKGSRVIGNDVELTVLITNTASDDVTVYLVGGLYQTGMSGSIAYDNEGNINEMADVLVSVGNKSLTEQYCAGVFPAKVPVKCHILVRNVAKEARVFAQIKLCFLCPQFEINNTGICFELNNISFR